MRSRAPFRQEDLAQLDSAFYARAARVIAMQEVHDGDRAPNAIALRHDCDADHSLRTAVAMAHWEEERGYRSTYYMLHSARYWKYPWFPEALDEIAGCGHEIGIHVDALAQALRTGEHPDVILDRAVRRLRDLGHTIRGAAGHGNPICIKVKRTDESPFANDEQFSECRRPDHGSADRMLARGKIRFRLTPRPLADFGLEYEALWSAKPWSWRCSDSGGKWLTPGFEETAQTFAQQTEVSDLPNSTEAPRQLHLLIHPDWWGEAFGYVKAVA